MKRRICGAVLLLVLLCAMTLPAAAAGTSLRLEGPETLPAEGESFTLRLTIQGNPGLCAAQYTLRYDRTYNPPVGPSYTSYTVTVNDYAKDSLNLYRVIDPQIWVRLVGRVNGANFTAIYGRSKAMGYRNITLPEGHTWESYTRFLLATRPARLRENYVRKFKTSYSFGTTSAEV